MKAKMSRGVLFLTFGFVAAVLIACANATSAPSASSAIDYTRIGGVGGFNDALTIDAKKHAVVSRRLGKSEFDLEAAALKNITDAFQTANFASIPADSMPRGVPADAFTYTLTYQGHTVKTTDGGVPKSLEPLITMLNQIVLTQGK